MKHIKLFELVDGYPTKGFLVEVREVYFSDGSDPVYGLYINGDLHKYGDNYHDDMDTWIKGFCDGLKWAGINLDYKILYCNDPHWVYQLVEMGGTPPNQLETLDGKLSDKAQW